MTEDSAEIRPPKGGLSDFLIQTKTNLFEPPPIPGHFDKQKNPNPEGNGEVLESDLPVVKEAIELLNKAKKEGGLVSKSENPFGSNLSNIKLEVLGDTQIYGSSPNEAVQRRSKALKQIEEMGPKAKETRKANLEKSNTVDPVFNSPLGFVATGESWAEDVYPTYSIQAFRASGEAITQDITRSQDFFKPDSAIAIIDIGDKSNPEAVLGDICLTAIEYENLRLKAERIAAETNSMHEKVKVFMALLRGNHDSDLHNKGLANEKANISLYGNQIFYQEVGEDYAILALDTNFASTFWWRYFELEKNALIVRKKEKLLKK